MEKLFPVEDRVVVRKDKYSLVKCISCRQVSIYPMPLDSEIGKLYPDDLDYYGEEIEKKPIENLRKRSKLFNYILSNLYKYPEIEKYSLFTKIKGKIVIKLLSKWLYRYPKFHIPNYVKNGILLEIGFGTGNALINFKNLGWHVIGTEANKKRCEQLKIKNNICTIHTSNYKLPLDDESVDVIYINQAFEHMPHPEYVMKEYFRLLKSEGEIIMTVPNISCMQAKLSGPKWRGIEAPRHLYLYTKETLSNLLYLSGFSEINVKPITLSLLDVIKFKEPPTSLNNNKYINYWWNNKYMYLLAAITAPSMGFGESLYVRALKK